MLPNLFPSVTSQPQFNVNTGAYNGGNTATDLNWSPQSSITPDMFCETPNASATSSNNFFAPNSISMLDTVFAQPGSASAHNQEFSLHPQSGVYSMNAIQQQQHNLRPQTITITLQYGSQKEIIVVERTPNEQMFQLLRQKAYQMVERQIQCSNDANSISEKVDVGELQLFLHDYKSTNMLEHLTTLSQLDNGSVVEIIRIERNEKPTRLHMLQVMSYITPTFCDYCGEILVGLIKQGLQCSLCKCNFHKKCTFAPRNNCSKNDQVAPNTFLTKNDAWSTSSAAGRSDADNSGTQAPQFQLPHTLSMHNYKTPTVCKVCDKMLLGFVKQGMRCRDCKVNVHKKCAAQLPPNCQISPENVITPNFDQMSFTDSNVGQESLSSDASSSAQIALQQQQQQFNKTTTETDNSNDMMLIPLARLPGSASSRVRQGSPLCEGWIIHFVLQQNPEENEHRRLRHYWILSNGAISMYNEYNDGVNPCRVYKQIQLAEIISLVRYNGPPINKNHPAHCFEIRTNTNIIYCVGENLETFCNAPPSKLPKHFGPYGVTSWESWFQGISSFIFKE